MIEDTKIEMLIHLLIYGLLDAVTISSVAIALALLYNTTKTLNFALAVGFTIGGFTAYSLKILYQQNMWIVILGAVFFSGLFGVILELIIFRFLFVRKVSPMVQMMASLGLYLAVINILALIYGNELLTLRPGIDKTYSIIGVIITRTQIFQLAAEIVCLGLLFGFLSFTTLGVQIRAFSDNPLLSKTLGFNIGGIRVLVATITFGLMGTIGALYSLDFGIYPYNGMPIFLLAAVAMIVGGTGSLNTALIGGIILGVMRNALLLFASDQWQSLITFSILGLIILFRPQGILSHTFRIEEI